MIAKIKKNKRVSNQSLVFPVIWLIMFFGIIGFFVMSNWRMVQRRQELSSRIDYLKGEIKTLEERNSKLTAQMSTSSYESLLEKEARERLNLKKPGEEVVTILNPEAKDDASSQEEEKKSWWNVFNW